MYNVFAEKPQIISFNYRDTVRHIYFAHLLKQLLNTINTREHRIRTRYIVRRIERIIFREFKINFHIQVIYYNNRLMAKLANYSPSSAQNRHFNITETK